MVVARIIRGSAGLNAKLVVLWPTAASRLHEHTPPAQRVVYRAPLNSLEAAIRWRFALGATTTANCVTARERAPVMDRDVTLPLMRRVDGLDVVCHSQWPQKSMRNRIFHTGVRDHHPLSRRESNSGFTVIRPTSARWLPQLTANAFNRLGQYASSSANRVYYYTKSIVIDGQTISSS